jgi:hypothetical protein
MEEEIRIMNYAYYTLNKTLKEILDVMIDKYGDNGKWVFLEFAQRNKSKKEFFDDYMNTCFI